ncbi:hypothetical protein [Plasmodium yoelii yoelii]|uniref:Uncharacterized protein n=1 Tax=Plasmodium yoelii yoelii TaxID=73239 RepID=Q7RI30_PLAYO|nr:hypothetical protein [Plasmodium yoelii yoelii]
MFLKVNIFPRLTKKKKKMIAIKRVVQFVLENFQYIYICLHLIYTVTRGEYFHLYSYETNTKYIK